MKFLSSVLRNNYSPKDENLKGLFGIALRGAILFSVGEVVNIISQVDIVDPSTEVETGCKASMYIIGGLDIEKYALVPPDKLLVSQEVEELTSEKGNKWYVSKFSNDIHIDSKEILTTVESIGDSTEHLYYSPSLVGKPVTVKRAQGGYLFNSYGVVIAFALRSKEV